MTVSLTGRDTRKEIIIKQWARQWERCGSSKKHHNACWLTEWPHNRTSGTFSTILCIEAHFMPPSWGVVSTIKLETTKTITWQALRSLLKTAKSQFHSKISQWFSIKQYQRPCVGLDPVSADLEHFWTKWLNFYCS